LWDRNADAEADMVMSVCMFIRREIIDRMKAVPDAFFMYFANDYICLQALRQGFKNYYVKDAGIVHYERFADQKLFASKQLDYKMTAVPVADRMERDKFLFLKVLCNRPVYLLFQILSTMEHFIHALASIKQARRFPNPVMKKYFNTIKVVWRV
jgi:GT2 family glycosyltransferase